MKPLRLLAILIFAVFSKASVFAASTSYFGTFANNNGSWALNVSDDGTGTFLGYLVQPNVAFVTSVHLGLDGQFTLTPADSGGIRRSSSVTSSANGATGDSVVVITPPAIPSPPTTPTPPTIIITPVDPTTISNGSGNGDTNYTSKPKLTDITLTGSISHGIVVGRVVEFSQDFAGASDTSSGTTTGFAGYHTSSQVAAESGSLSAIVSGSGQALILAATPDFADIGMMSVSSTGTISGTTNAGTRFKGALSVGQSDFSASVTPVSGSALTFQNILPSSERTDRLVNLSSRGASGTGNRVMILGFVIGGTSPRNVLIRGVGPTLYKYGVGRPMGNPVLQLFNKSQAVIAQNDDWSSSANATAIAAAAGRAGAFSLDAGSRDASLLIQLSPGVYSAITHDDADTSGPALTEIYDVDGVDSTSPAIVNLSIRGNVDTGNSVLIAGFVITGNSAKRLLIRAVGPTLATFGLQSSEVLADPYLRIVQNGNTLLTNDNWRDASNASEVPSVSSTIGASTLPANSKDAVILTTLGPGVYSAIASGVSGGTGIALVEVYQIP